MPLTAPAAAEIDVSGQLQRAATGRSLAIVRVDGSTDERLRVRVMDVNVAELDGLLGGVRLAEWLGDSGQLLATVHRGADGDVADIDASFPRCTGGLTVRSEGEMISLESEEATLMLGRLVVQDLIGDPEGTVLVTRDLPLSVEVRSLSVPASLLAGEPFDPDDVDIDVWLAGGPLEVRDDRIGRTSVRSLNARLHTRNLDTGLQVTAGGEVAVDGQTGGGLELNATLSGLVHARRLTPDRARLGGSLSGQGLRTRVLDRLAGLNGLLAAALGEQVTVDAVADEFGHDAGSLDLHLRTTDGGSLNAIVQSADEGLSLEADRPAIARLPMTESVRDRLLGRLHPMLAELRTAQPVRATIREAFMPIDGDIFRARADLAIEIGRAEFDPGSVMLEALGIHEVYQERDPEHKSAMRGRIRDVSARLERGIIIYEHFEMQVEQVTMSFRGTVNLNTGTVDLRTEAPIRDGMKRRFRATRRLAPGTMIPFRIHGSLDDPVTEIDWDEAVQNIPDLILEEVPGHVPETGTAAGR